MVRDHWAMENNLHWVINMVFRDDECRVRKDHAPANFTTIKHAAFNILKRAPGKDSMRVKRKRADWEDDFLYSVVPHDPSPNSPAPTRMFGAGLNQIPVSP